MVDAPAPEPAADGGARDAAAEPPVDVTSTMALRTGAGTDELEAVEVTETVEALALDALAPGTALLVVRRGPNAGSRFLLDSDVTTTGRHPDSDIFLDDITVSRRHAEFRRSEGGFAVVDVGSLNGTYVNRRRVDDVVLTGGDEVQIGKYRLVFHPADGGAE
jgi:pSer/pThr/pTyr-binding forkhead associated (FHA) protein